MDCVPDLHDHNSFTAIMWGQDLTYLRTDTAFYS